MEEKSCIHGITRGILISIITTFFLMIFLAIIMVIFDFSQGTYNYLYKFITMASLVLGSVVAAKVNERKGWITGFIVGLGFYFFIFLLSGVINGKISFTFDGYYSILIYVGVGTISGILGVNI